MFLLWLSSSCGLGLDVHVFLCWAPPKDKEDLAMTPLSNKLILSYLKSRNECCLQGCSTSSLLWFCRAGGAPSSWKHIWISFVQEKHGTPSGEEKTERAIDFATLLFNREKHETIKQLQELVSLSHNFLNIGHLMNDASGAWLCTP